MDAYEILSSAFRVIIATRPGTQELRRLLLGLARSGLANILEDARKQGTPDSTIVWSHFRMGEIEQQLGNTLAAQKNTRPDTT